MSENIPKYHPSYSDEENMSVYNFLQTASGDELVDAVRGLQEMYAERVPDIDGAFRNFEKEIQERLLLSEKRKELIKCRDEWLKYQTALFNYRDALIIREKYLTFKKTYRGKTPFRRFMTECREKYFPGRCEDFVHDAIASDGTNSYIGKPQEPGIYYHSADEIEASPKNNDKSLADVGEDSLRYLIMLLLSHIETPKENGIPAVILFLSRRYAARSHKGKGEMPLFTTEMLSYNELQKDIKRLLEEIKSIKQECGDILSQIESGQ